MPFPLTEEQRAAVENRGGGLLVSAAAGSGKTRVLVERLLSYVEQGESIDAFPVITYTRAAAAELRARIGRELSDRVALQPGSAHLRRQLTRLYGANISTIHALCASLLREFGHLLDIDPDFRLCTEEEAAVLRARALNDLLEACYETVERDSDFALLVDTMAAGRDDSRLVQIVSDIYDKVQSHPEPRRWLAEQEEAFALNGVSDAADTAWGRFLLLDAVSAGRYWRGRMEQARRLADRDAVVASNYGDSIAGTCLSLDAFLAAAERGWDAARSALPIDFPRAGAKKGAEDADALARVKSIRAACKKQMEKVSAQLDGASELLLQDLRAVHPAIRGLFALVRDFESAYAAEKSRRGLLDFSDLEHLAVKLLTEGENHTPNALAEELSGRWREVMVDEYQDTNEVQNAIFTALSHGGRTLFMVGDVKQSIYRFRLADPTIFLDKYRAFRPAAEAEEGEPRRVVLSRNFRSRPEVLEAANFLFRSLMSRELGEMDYTDEDALYPGGEAPPAGDCRTELAFLARPADSASDDEERPDKSLMEARFAAERISGLLEEGFPVQGKGGLKPLAPSDVAILLRSPSTVLPFFTRALEERGIPWRAEQGDDFFATTEVSTALSLLQIVDNPRQDVPLIAALRSPVYGFSGDRLALLRAQARTGDFYGAVQAAAERGEADCADVLQELSVLRRDAGERTAHELVWQIYQQTNLLGLFSAMGDGGRRRDNLLALYELARSCEKNGYCGLFGFLTYLERLRASGGSLPAARRGGGDGVAIMSIHRSKGLEFPVVLLCGLARQMNREDTKKPILFHSKLGVGPQLLDRERMLQSPTLARTAVAAKLEREMMAEELRLLYVAMTRARDKLILTVAPGRGIAWLSRLADDLTLPVPPRALMGCESVGQWVLLAALCRPEAEALRAAAGWTGDVPEEERVPFGPAWDIRVVDGAPYLTPCGDRRSAPDGERPTAQAPADLVARFTWRYPHEAVTDIPSKLTATQLKGREKDTEAAEESAARPTAQTRPFRRPRFAAEELGLTPAQKGTAQHLAMQYLNFDRTGSLAEIREEIARLQAEQFLTPQQAEAVQAEKLLAFFHSELGRALTGAEELHREFKFSLLSPAERYYGAEAAGEQVLLQGVVDCWFVEGETGTVVDFKTDRVTEETVLQRAEEYRPQLEAYSEALARITGRTVGRKVLWFFALDRGIVL